MKKSKIILFVVLALMVAVVILIAAGVFSGNKDSEAPEPTPKPAAENVGATDVDAVKVYAGDADLLSTPQKVTVIDFNATWCGPCRQYSPIFHGVAAKYADKIDFYSVDVDNYPDLARRFDVTSIPKTVVLYPDGSTKSELGLLSAAQLESLLNQ